MRIFDAFICVSNKLIMHAYTSRGKKIYATLDGGSYVEIIFEHGQMRFYNKLPRQTWILIARNKFFL